MPAPPIYPVAALRAIESLALPGAVPPLMERAGAAAAAVALDLLPGTGALVLVACGPGNNGGDGFVVARRLHAAGHRVSVAFAADPARLPPDAAAAHAAWLAFGGTTHPSLPTPPEGGWSMVIDALFGIGLQRPIEGLYAEWIDTVVRPPAACVWPWTSPAVSMPTRATAPGACFQADHTSPSSPSSPGCSPSTGPTSAAPSTWRHPRPGRRSPGPRHRPRGAPALFAEHLQPAGATATRAATATRPHRRRARHGRRGPARRAGSGLSGRRPRSRRAARPGRLGRGHATPRADVPQRPALLAETGMLPSPWAPGLGQSDAARALVATALGKARPSSWTPTPSTCWPATPCCKTP
jgi:hydroxyethylthiazole kinase-like uncharacterized protein yjeF